MCNDLQHWLTNRCLLIDSKRPTHGGVYKRDDVLLINDHHAIVNVIKYGFQPRMFSFRDLGTALQGGGCPLDFLAKPVANTMRILETAFHRINNIISPERRH